MTDVAFKAVQNYYWALQDMTDRNQVQKLYRHARIWTRFSKVYAGILDKEQSVEVNAQFKRLKNERLEELQNGDYSN